MALEKPQHKGVELVSFDELSLDALEKEYFQKGVVLWKKLQDALGKSVKVSEVNDSEPPWEIWTIHDDLDNYYNDFWKGTPNPLSTLHSLPKDELSSILGQNDITTGKSFHHWRVQQARSHSPELDTLPGYYPAREFLFNQLYDVKQGVIIASCLWKDKACTDPNSYWSSVTMRIWRWLSSSIPTPSSAPSSPSDTSTPSLVSTPSFAESSAPAQLVDINWIFHHTITSGLRHCLKSILSDQSSKTLLPPTSSNPEDLEQAREFLICLGSPNGRGTVHLLIDHMNEFAGKRDVERIVVYEVKPEKKSRFARSWLGAFHLGIKIAKVGDKE